MVRAENPALNHPRHLAAYLRLCSIQTGIIVQPLAYNDVKRMITIESDSDSDEEDTVVAGDDPLASMLVLAITDMSCSDEHCEIRPIYSVSALFSRGELQRSLKPRLMLAFGLRNGVEIVGCAVVCSFIRDETLGSKLFTDSFNAQNKLPKFDSTWLFLDVVASKLAPSGSILVVSAVLQAIRQKKVGTCCIAVSSAGHRLFKSLGFTTFRYKERGSSARHMCYLRHTDLSFAQISRKLKFEGSKKIVENVCWREALSSSAKNPLVGRC